MHLDKKRKWAVNLFTAHLILKSFPIVASVCKLVISLDKLYLTGIVGAQVGAEQIVLPLCKVKGNVLFGVIEIVPMGFPGFVCLSFANDEAPAVASYVLKIEKRIYFAHVAVVDSVKPFGAKQRSAKLSQSLNERNHILVGLIAMEADNVG